MLYFIHTLLFLRAGLFGADAVDIPKTRRRPQEEEDDQKNRARPGRPVYSPANGGPNQHGRHKLAREASGKAQNIARRPGRAGSFLPLPFCRRLALIAMLRGKRLVQPFEPRPQIIGVHADLALVALLGLLFTTRRWIVVPVAVFPHSPRSPAFLITARIGRCRAKSEDGHGPARRRDESAAELDEFAELAMRRTILAPKNSVKIKS